MPMRLRERPVARQWAILLARLTDADRSRMVLVSKTMRYAVYLSAAEILRIDYRGSRLSSYLRSVRDAEVMDLWPYLRARQRESAGRRSSYDASFVPAFYRSQGASSPISPSLWASPDNEYQIQVAIRFLIAKAWFAISLPHSPDKVRSWLNATVVDAQEISKDAVWSITQRQPSGRSETLYVVYETGEVIGKSTSSLNSADIPIRNDWLQHLSAFRSHRSSLMELVVWHNGEEYDRGISKLWLSRVPDGDARRRVAERYVLACVAPNSVSGAYKTARQMADEFASLGDAAVTGQRKNAGAAQLALYFPEHHYVECVSFVSSKPVQPLHPALAAVQTPGREYIVLRDTGMHVGCEEDGVAEVWMKILGCDTRGVAL
ncbi:hypothetical protein AURDEDRAFT_175770 [Auricularia subglabra TFB-10046 SS5]|uniref:Uncharacterized protein n=1 Tax=Auricularia subglabra (strain TFB-10046 / SS5) TaxID=717982 RepID=J0D7M8_AURST|nr:hypothetical protein AURDEDRAFT_175770 [Auricularia subglabra TFB-10046 SS5]